MLHKWLHREKRKTGQYLKHYITSTAYSQRSGLVGDLLVASEEEVDVHYEEVVEEVWQYNKMQGETRKSSADGKRLGQCP